MKVKICILLILVTILNSKVFSQNRETKSSFDKNVKIYPPRNNTLYIGRNNLTVIGYKVDTFKNILVTASQGTVSSIDKYLHYIDLVKKGKVLISVYNIANKKRMLLNQRTFYVDSAIITKEEKAINKLSESCQLSVEGFSGVKVPFSVIQ